MSSEQLTLTHSRFASQPSPPETQADLLDRAAEYARSVPLDLEYNRIAWEVSTRAKRQAGLCRYHPDTGELTIRLTWAAFEEFGWEQFKRVIRHELIHAWEFQQFGESSHGERFERKARELGVDVRCPQFTDARLHLECDDPACAWLVRRYRASTAVTDPQDRRCGECGGTYSVVHTVTGHRWRTNEGYREARAEIGDDW